MRHAIRVVSLTGIILLSLAATTPPSLPPTLQTQRLEVVDKAGQVRFVARATAQGGRLEVRNALGEILFSIGADPDDPERPDTWERTLRQINSHDRELTRNRRTLDALAQQLRQVELEIQQLNRTLKATKSPENRKHQRHDLMQQRRALDALARQVSRLDRQVRSLERR